MEIFFIVLVGILFLLAISDLAVGVSNDAVNFLNSAIGAKVAPFRVIMIIAAIGVLVGATFSGGMMEVARKGIFHPEFFSFQEIMFLFLAVMITDVILLDIYNTVGLPTSTTVSIVFELLGAAVGLSLLKVINNPEITSISQYINSDKALQIIFGILLSVVISFAIGALVQYITRLVFSFNFERKLKYLGGIFGGVAITAITYFMLIKGAKGATFMTDGTKEFILSNTLTILGLSFVLWTIVTQLLHSLFKVDILKFIVLIGTFALAMAFAGNDLVNFIGVPLAGLASFKAFAAAPGQDATQVMMEALAGPVKTNTIFLVGAGIVMVITLWTSKKARSVVNTSIDLSRQHEGTERFGSSGFSRVVVRRTIAFGNTIKSILPSTTRKYINQQFDASRASQESDKSGVSFDKIRAAVNLIVAAILISFATSLKLPLSTTYVTFMVAMGTSLADGAWGRESAVYRITGVLSVIGGWFLTALSAFTVAFIIVNFISWGEVYAIAIMVIIAITMIIRTHKFHNQRSEATEKRKQKELALVDNASVMNSCSVKTKEIVENINKNYTEIINALYNEDRKNAKRALKTIRQLNKDLKEEQNNLGTTILKLQEEGAETSHYYVQVIDYLREIGHCLHYMAEPSFKHIDNMHKGLTVTQKEELDKIQDLLYEMLNIATEIIENNIFVKIDDLIETQNKLLEQLKQSRKNQIKRIKHQDTGKKNSMLYLNILQETKNLSLYSVNLIKAHRDFVIYNDSEHF
ncbi:MAG: inorganic phosphate transporter [Bacteroidales bacterium]